MKVLFVLSALAAVALANPGVIAPAAVSPLAYSGYNPYYNQLGYSALGYSGLGYSGLGYNYAAAPFAHSTYAAAPIAHTYAAAPIAVPAVTKTQYHAQDELGQASYGYAHPGQTHNAVRDAHGNVAGSYSYVDPNGKIVKTDYIADGAGFRVASNALPVAPVAPVVALPVGPAPVQDTPEVVEARIAHFAEVAAAKSRSKRGVLAYNAPIAAAYPYAAYPYAHAYSAPAITSYAAHSYAAPALSYAAHGYAAPALAYSAAVPAVRAATLTTVVNNPGHAVSYRVD